MREGGKLRPASWPEAFKAIADRLKGTAPDRIGAVAGDLCDAESMLALKDLMAALGSGNVDCRQDGAALDASRREFYLFNSGIAGIEEADAILLVGSNPRRESPVLNARIRKRWLAGGCRIGSVGALPAAIYDFTQVGEGPQGLFDLGDFKQVLSDAKRPMIIVGQAALAREDGAAVLAAAWSLAASVGAIGHEWHGFNVLHTAASRVGGLDLGFVPGPGGKGFAQMLDGGVDLLWLLGADEFDTAQIGSGTFVVYQGHHGDRGAARADVILPGAAYTEKSGTWVNTEGRVQRGFLSCQPPGEARDDWSILRAFSAVIGKPLPYDTLDALRTRLETLSPVFRWSFSRTVGGDLNGPAGGGELGSGAFVPAVADYYLTNPIARASAVMAECSKLFAAPAAMAAE